MTSLAESLIHPWNDRLLRDLQPFADPGTQVEIAASGRTLQASWQQRGVERSLELTGAVDGNVRVTADGRTESYQGFFAGPTMGDLTGLAKMMLQAQPRNSVYVRTRARLLDATEGDRSENDAVELIRQETARTSEETGTVLLVVTGEPGAGKTRALQEIVRSTAHDYIKSQSSYLYLYINAQGRALARFNEALATELQDLRSLLTYHAVSTLVRLGLVIPIVDGFDELLGSGGYEDAFSSLSSFLEELDGMGAIVASARSTYYEHEFVLRANRVSSLGAQAWTQRPIEICAWSESDFEEYLRQACRQLDPDTQTVVTDSIRGLFKSQPELRAKPFFVVRVTDSVLQGNSLAGNGSLLDQLVTAYLKREQSEKLLDRSGKPLLPLDQLRTLYVELAEEMWNQETRQLDARSVRELAELALLTNDMDSVGSQVIVERMPTMAFLATGTKPGSVTFEHESFFSYFLGTRLSEKIAARSAGLERFLGRSLLPEEVASHATATLMNGSNVELQPLFDEIAAACRRATLSRSIVRESSGVLTMQILREKRSLQNLSISGVDMPGGTLSGCEFESVHFSDVEFRRTDLSDTRLVRCMATQSSFIEITVNLDTTQLDLSGSVELSDFRGLRIYSEKGLAITYEPKDMQSALVRLGALKATAMPRLRSVSPEVLHLLDVLARGYLRSNPITVEDYKLSALKRSAIWDQLEQTLIKHGIVAPEYRETRGSKKMFLRRQVDIWRVLEGQIYGSDASTQIQKLWDELEARFPPS